MPATVHHSGGGRGATAANVPGRPRRQDELEPPITQVHSRPEEWQCERWPVVASRQASRNRYRCPTELSQPPVPVGHCGQMVEDQVGPSVGIPGVGQLGRIQSLRVRVGCVGMFCGHGTGLFVDGAQQGSSVGELDVDEVSAGRAAEAPGGPSAPAPAATDALDPGPRWVRRHNPPISRPVLCHSAALRQCRAQAAAEHDLPLLREGPLPAGRCPDSDIASNRC